jgi:hypothetical protein
VFRKENRLDRPGQTVPDRQDLPGNWASVPLELSPHPSLEKETKTLLRKRGNKRMGHDD